MARIADQQYEYKNPISCQLLSFVSLFLIQIFHTSGVSADAELAKHTARVKTSEYFIVLIVNKFCSEVERRLYESRYVK